MPRARKANEDWLASKSFRGALGWAVRSQIPPALSLACGVLRGAGIRVRVAELAPQYSLFTPLQGLRRSGLVLPKGFKGLALLGGGKIGKRGSQTIQHTACHK